MLRTFSVRSIVYLQTFAKFIDSATNEIDYKNVNTVL